jgi:PAS domain S-box-containing protein
LTENVTQIAWATDRTGRSIWFNKQWYRYTGTSFEETQDSRWQALIHPDHVNRLIDRIAEGSGTGTPWVDLFPLRAADGAYCCFLTNAVPVRSETGEIVRWFITGTDITGERHRIWDASQALLIVSDTNGRIIAVNPAWSEALGWDAADLLGKTGEFIVHPDDRYKSWDELIKLNNGQRTDQFENRVRSKHGAYKRISWQAIRDRDFIYGVGRDVTLLRDTEERLRVARRELSTGRRQVALDAMTVSIAHEIRQPLAGIMANASAALRWIQGEDNAQGMIQKNIEQIMSAGERIKEIIDNIRSTFELRQPVKNEVDLNTLVREVLHLIGPELDNNGVLIRIALLDNLPKVLAEQVQLRQVIFNLVTNAIDAMSSIADRERQLTIKSEIDDEQQVARIAIQDTGVGISAANLSRIWEPFFTTKSEGMGIGLFICRSIIESLGGRLWAVPASPYGMAFYIDLPAHV